MLRVFNSFGKLTQTVRPVKKAETTIFTCGPSVYQRAHIGNFRTFLFEDILVRYLEFLGQKVRRGMNFTDIEDKALAEAAKRKTTVSKLTDENIRNFLKEMELLRLKIPDYLPRASECVEEAAEIIDALLRKSRAYRHGGNIYFAPLTFPGFGKLFGLDMSLWPAKPRRFHRDTYPGVQWNRGDFILWHGGENSQTTWDTVIGRGRPSWNVQDPSMIIKHFSETLTFYCGGVDNLYRHHDYSIAILESLRPYPMARYWLHGEHLHVDGQKMSKSRGNIIYTDTLLRRGFSPAEIRFFLIYCHYRKRLTYTDRHMLAAAEQLRAIKGIVKRISRKGQGARSSASGRASALVRRFASEMDSDLGVKGAVDSVELSLRNLDVDALSPSESAGIIDSLKRIDTVLQVIF